MTLSDNLRLPSTIGELSDQETTEVVYIRQLVFAVKQRESRHRFEMGVNYIAGFCTWVLLAGFVSLPGAYSTLKELRITNSKEERVIRVFLHIPLFAAAWFSCALGAVGMGFLWWRCRSSGSWLCENLFWPGIVNGILGMVSTLVTVFSAQQGETKPAFYITTLAITAACTVICGVLWIVYKILRARRLAKALGHPRWWVVSWRGLAKALKVQWCVKDEPDDKLESTTASEANVLGVESRRESPRDSEGGAMEKFSSEMRSRENSSSA